MYKSIRILVVRILFCIITVFIFDLNMQAQSCRDVLDNCSTVDPFYNYKAMARTYKIHPHQKVKIFYMFYGSKGYNIALCSKNDSTKYHVKLSDRTSGYVYWDNIEDNYSKSINISFGSTQRIVMEITPVDPEQIAIGNDCLGVVIRYHKGEDESSSPSVPAPPPF